MRYAVEFANVAYRGVVLAGYSSESVAAAHSVINALLCGCRLGVGHSVVRVDVEIVAFECELGATELAGGEVEKAFRVERLAHISYLEVEVGTSAATSVAAEGYWFASFYKFVFVGNESRKVCVVCFQTVGVTYYHKVAVSAGVAHCAHHANLAVECGADGVAYCKGNVGAVVVAGFAEFES